MSTASLKAIAHKISERFEIEEKARERSLSLHRLAIKNSGQAIRAIHRGEVEPARLLLADTSRTLEEINRLLENFPEIRYAGFLQDAQKEYAEACITLAIIAGESLPDPDELKLGFAPYLNGLAEAVGELRRNILDRIREGKVERGEEFLDIMDEIYCVLASMDFTDAVTRGLRRSTDVARSIIEKTRADFTCHLEHCRLEESMQKLGKRLDRK